jgi:GNAT superfamily N-acetyltransferase
VLIRLARAGDLPALMTMLRRVIPLMHADGIAQWDDEYPTEAIFARDIEAGELWVAEAEDGALGGVIAITTEQYPEYAHVGLDLSEPAIVAHRLAVDPAFRGTGIAAALMQQAETVAQARGIPILRVDTSAQNTAAQRLTVKLGYTFAGETNLGFRGGMRIFCYEKRL